MLCYTVVTKDTDWVDVGTYPSLTEAEAFADMEECLSGRECVVETRVAVNIVNGQLSAHPLLDPRTPEEIDEFLVMSHRTSDPIWSLPAATRRLLVLQAERDAIASGATDTGLL
jgi:hypothetical protein